MLYDIQNEKAVLGCMMLDCDCFNKGIIGLTRRDFHEQKNRILFDKMKMLSDNNTSCDIVTCQDNYNTFEYLTEVTNIIPSTQGFNNYVRQLKALSVRREYLERAEEVKKIVYNSNNLPLVDLKNNILANMDIEIKSSVQAKTDINSIADITFSEMETQEESRCSYGYGWLDKNTTGVTPKLIYLGARPSIGKTTFAMNIAINLASKGLKVAIFSLETAKEQIFKKLVSIQGNIKFSDISRYRDLPKDKKEQIKNVADKLRKMHINIFDNIFSVEGIRAECRRLKNNNDLDFVIVDYIQLCETNKNVLGANERVSYISRQFKLMQMEFKKQFLVLCQLSRESAKEKRFPKLTDLRDSGSLEQDANDVWFLHDNNYGEYAENQEEVGDISLIIAKQREGQRDIYTDLLFYKNTQLFCEKCPF